MSKSDRVTRRSFVTASLAGAASATSFSFPCPAVAAPTKVRYTLSWLPTSNTRSFMPLDNSVISRNAASTSISRGYGSMAATQAVSTGKFEMGGGRKREPISYPIMRGLNLHILGTQGYDATLGVLALEKGPIKSPKDLGGRKIGVSRPAVISNT